MKEVLSTVIEIYKKYEVNDVDNKYFIKAIDMLKEEFAEKDYHYSRFFQRLGDKVFMHIRITSKDI